MRSSIPPLVHKHRFKDGSGKIGDMCVHTDPSTGAVKVMKSGGKMTAERMEDLQMGRISKAFRGKRS
jgi:hypothetical protein